MALTPTQIKNALSFASTVTLNNPSAPYNTIEPTDITNWAGVLGLNPGVDTAKMLLNIIDPLGLPVYKNTGWDTDNYAAPDIEFDGTTSITKTLPVITGTTEVVSGTYTIWVKVQVVKGVDPAVTTDKQFSTIITWDDLERTVKFKATYDCFSSPSSFTVTDETSLAANNYQFQSISRTLTITPPVASGQAPVTGASNTLTAQNLWAPAPYQYGVEATITFKLGVDTFEVYYEGAGSTQVVCEDVLCKMYCCLLKLRNAFYAEVNGRQREIIHERLFLGQLEYTLAVRARLCGNNDAVSGYISKFYTETKCDPNCDCCDDFGPAPVIPFCECEDGTDGRTPEFQQAGTWFQWRYVGDLAWINLFNFATITGTPGANGLNGVALLANQYPALATVGTGSFESLLEGRTPFILVKDTLKTDFDMIRGRVMMRRASSAQNQLWQVIFNGTVIASGAFGNNGDLWMIEFWITRASNTQAKHDSRSELYVSMGSVLYAATDNSVGFDTLALRPQTMAGLDLTSNDYLIDVQGNSVVVGDVICELFQLEYLAYGLSNSGNTSSILNTHEFLLTAALTYTFDGTVTAYNPLGKSLIGKEVKEFFIDGLLKTIINADYTFNEITGAITIPATIPGTPAKILYQ